MVTKNKSSEHKSSKQIMESSMQIRLSLLLTTLNCKHFVIVPLTMNNQQQQQQQHNLIQLLSQHLVQQQSQNKSPARNPQLVINLEDVLNVIMNAASIVSSQTVSQSSPTSQQAQPFPPESELPFNTKPSATPPSDTKPNNSYQSPLANHGVAVTTSPYDDIISQNVINSYIGLDTDGEFSSLDSLTRDG